MDRDTMVQLERAYADVQSLRVILMTFMATTVAEQFESRKAVASIHDMAIGMLEQLPSMSEPPKKPIAKMVRDRMDGFFSQLSGIFPVT